MGPKTSYRYGEITPLIGVKLTPVSHLCSANGQNSMGSVLHHSPGFAEVARVAAEMYRPHLATLLLNHEPRSHAQVQVLVQLSREGDEFLSLKWKMVKQPGLVFD